MMLALLRKNWFFIGIAIVVLMAFEVPMAGGIVRDFNILNIGIFLVFFTTGLTLETSSIASQLRRLKTPVASMISSLVLFPLLAWSLARSALSPESVVGVCIIATAPVTIASGTVMTNIGRGNVPLSLFICVLGNVLAIFTMPMSLNLLIASSESIELPVLKMLSDLILTVLLPTVLGQFVRPAIIDALKVCKKPFSIFNQCVVLLIIFNAVAASATRILNAGTLVLQVLMFMVFLHAFMLAMNFGISMLMRLDLSSTTAFTIHTSQKTLAVSYLVWAGYFASQYPMALIPGIVYHLTQMIMDTFVAERFRVAYEKRTAASLVT